MLATAILFGALAAPLPVHPSTDPTADPFTTDAVTAQPTVRFTTPTNGESLPFGPVRVVIAAQPGTGATLARGTLSGAGITGGQWNFQTGDGGQRVFELTNLISGSQSLNVTVTDSLGRPAQANVTFTLRAQVGTDRTPPVVEFIAPTADPLVIASGASVTFSGSASDDIALSTVTWYLTGQRIANGPLSAMGTWSTTFTGLPDGRYSLAVTARDRTGKSTSRSRPFTVGSGIGTPPPQGVPEKGGDIVNCGAGSGLSALFLLFAPLAALLGRRRIE